MKLSCRLSSQGVPESSEVQRTLPSDERRRRGPVCVIECFEEIPCDPCHQACPRGAIAPFTDINHLPQIDHDLCDGCGSCISRCPGLAIFVVDESVDGDEAVVRMPYEFLPLPEAGQHVWGVSREGEVVTPARVVKVQSGKKLDKTAVVWLAVPEQYAYEVRFFRLQGGVDDE